MPSARTFDFSTPVARSMTSTIVGRIIIHHMPSTRMSNTSMRNVYDQATRTILRVNPTQIISVGFDYLRELPIDIRLKYKHEAYQIISFNDINCQAVYNILHLGFGYDHPVYLIGDISPEQIDIAESLEKCLKRKKVKVEYTRVGTLRQLVSVLRKTARKPRGILVSAVESVVDTEFNRDIRPQEINNLMRRMNSMHLDLTFDIHQTNLSIAIAPRLLYSGGVVTGTSAIFIDVERMISLDAILVYKNLFPLTSGVLSK